MKDLVFVKGKNLLNKDKGFAGFYISSTGVITSGDNNALFSQIIRVLPNTAYTISCKQIVNNFAFSIYDENNNFITRRFETGVSSMTQTMPQNAAYMKVQFNYDNSTTITQSIIDSLDLMLVQGSTVTLYEPYEDKKIMIKNKNGVYEEFYNENENKLSSNIIWQGNHYTKGNSNMQYFNEPLEDGKLYMFYAKGISSNYIQAIPFIAGVSSFIQQSYYDGTTAARWRIMINSAKTGFYLDDNSLNMQDNTAIISCIKVDN